MKFLQLGMHMELAIGQEEVDRMKSTMKIVDEFGKLRCYKIAKQNDIRKVDEFAGEIISLGKQYNIRHAYNEFHFIIW